MKQPQDVDELRVAIIGCGALTELFYVPALHCLGRKCCVTVAALIDPDASRAAAMARHFPGSKAGGGLSDIPDDTQLAIVASPAGFHAEQTIELLRRGLHVLCEKPMAPSAAECDAMIAEARRAGRLLALGHFKRFFPATRQIKELVDTQAFGRVRHFRFLDGAKFRWPAKSRAFFERRSGGGGVLIDAGVHTLDLALWWFGGPAELRCADDAMGGVEANVRLSFTYSNGISGDVILSRDWDMANRYVIQFERGWIAWDPIDANHIDLGWGERYALKATTQEAGSLMGQPAAGREVATRHQAFMHEVENMLDAVRGRARVEVTGEDGRRVMALIEQCYANSTLIDMPWMTAAERQRGLELRCSP
jgi:predicted dehydrogenase